MFAKQRKTILSIIYQRCRLWRRPCDRRGTIWGPRSRWGGRRDRRIPARSPPERAGSGAPTCTQRVRDPNQISRHFPWQKETRIAILLKRRVPRAAQETHLVLLLEAEGPGEEGGGAGVRAHVRDAPRLQQRRGGMGLREAVLEGSRRHRCCCLPGTWGRRRRCRWIRPAFSRPSDPPHGWSCSESETETETASSEPPSTLLTLWCTESVFRVEACLESGRVARQRGRRSGWWVTWLEEEGNGWQAGGGRGATGIGGSASLLHHSSPHQNPAASEPRRATNRPRPRHGVDQPRRAALAVAARLPGPPPPRPRRALPLHSPPARPPPPRAERYPRHSRSHAACKASRAGLTGRVRSCCGCRRVAVPAGGDLQRAGSGADQHCAGDARPADEHTGGRRDGDAGAAGGPEGAGWGLRRQVPRQAAPSPGRFPPWLGRHSRQCRVKFAVATASLSSFYFLVQLMRLIADSWRGNFVCFELELI